MDRVAAEVEWPKRGCAKARVYFEVDPENPLNRVIVDLDKAPRNAQGKVEFSADLYLLKPKDQARGNGAVLVETPRRGGKGICGSSITLVAPSWLLARLWSMLVCEIS